MALVYYNGRIMDDTMPVLLASDRSALYGDGLFETMFAMGERVAFLNDHLTRLFQSARALKMTLPAPRKEYLAETRDGIQKMLQRLGATYGRVRLTLSRGSGIFGPSILPDQTVNQIITVHAMEPLTPQQREDGWSAMLASFPRNERSPLFRYKSLNYLENILGRNEAIAQGMDEALFLNLAGRVCEGATSNLFLIKQKRLITPPMEEGLLPGIARNQVLMTAETEGMRPIRRPITLQDVLTADEAFMTNSIVGVMPLVRVLEHPIGDGTCGPKTMQLAAAFFKAQERSLNPEAKLDDLPF